ncbi:MAG: HAD family hydrolase [Chloroflexi bacterium]|nr:HAD family hydrolase [Chloroflexota bacterium]
MLFDLDETLMPEEPVAMRCIVDTARPAADLHGIDARDLATALREEARKIWHTSPFHGFCNRVGISSWEALWSEFPGDGAELAYLRSWRGAYRLGSWQAALERFGIDNQRLAQQLADAFPPLRAQTHPTFADAVPCLERLSRECRIAVVTNGVRDNQLRKLAGAGVDDLPERIFVSSDFGAGKPSPAFFGHVLHTLSVAPSACVFVGDSVTNDIIGASTCGIATIWVNRDGRTDPRTAVARQEVGNLRDVDIGLIRRLLRDF